MEWNSPATGLLRAQQSCAACPILKETGCRSGNLPATVWDSFKYLHDRRLAAKDRPEMERRLAVKHEVVISAPNRKLEYI